MNRGEDILKEACAQIAMDETDALEKGISSKMERASDTLYQRHRKKVFSLIAQNTKKNQKRMTPWLRAAACLVLILGAVYWTLQQNPQDVMPATQIPTATVMPYYTAVPTASLVPAHTPETTSMPAETPGVTEMPTKSPTEEPTSPPTYTPSPAITPTPAPTLPPEPARNIWPETWSGIYFPAELPDDYALLETREENNKRTAVYADGQGKTLSFTEYDGSEMLSIPENAKAEYVALHGGAALQLTENDTATWIWQMEERTLVLTADLDLIEKIAKSVEKISGE